MKVNFNVPAGSGISVSGYIDGTITLYIKAAYNEELNLDMNEETAIKVGHALLKMTGTERQKGSWNCTGRCSCCGEFSEDTGNYCSNCGAEMVR